MFIRIVINLFVFTVAAVAFLTLGAVNDNRSNEVRNNLSGAVSELWGQAQEQEAPQLTLHWWEREATTTQVIGADGKVHNVDGWKDVARTRSIAPQQSRVRAEMDLDRREKGLLTFDLYSVRFDGAWTFRHDDPVSREASLQFVFPAADGVYDAFRFEVDGVDVGATAEPVAGVVRHSLRLEPGRDVRLAVHYVTRGMGQWSYRPSRGVGRIEDFELDIVTDFAEVDFPAGSLSPSQRGVEGEGAVLRWDFSRVVTGSNLGVVIPSTLQAGELAEALAFSAPVSLALFLFWMAMIAVLRGLHLHVMHLLLVAAAFFAFNLLFSYTADRLPLWGAFTLSAAVSLGLVLSYLRLVVGARHAFVEAGIAQLFYQVGFAAAHFLEGYTGLCITVLGIITLFFVMQLTGKVRWEDVGKSPAVGASGAAALPQGAQGR